MNDSLNKIAPTDLSELYHRLITDYKEEPGGVLEEYKSRFSRQEKFIRYSSTIFSILMTLLMSSFAIVYDTFLSIEVIWERAIISGLYGTAVVGLTLKLFFVYDGKNDFPKYHKIKDVYKDAFLNLSYNQYDRALVSERLYSKWLLIKWWRDKRFYGL